jgi:micrococcal nuclease
MPFAPLPTPLGNCDPLYPAVYIPPPPPDLDCDDLSQRNFRVLQPDLHILDDDNNGIGS